MTRRILVGVVGLALLIGCGQVLAKEKGPGPAGRKQKQRQAAKQRARAQRLHHQQSPEKQQARAQKLRQQQRSAAGSWKPRAAGGQMMRPGRRLQQHFNEWFEAVLQAHRDNDQEKMGQLLRRMNQVRKQMHKPREAMQQRLSGLRRGGAMDRGGPGFGLQQRPMQDMQRWRSGLGFAPQAPQMWRRQMRRMPMMRPGGTGWRPQALRMWRRQMRPCRRQGMQRGFGPAGGRMARPMQRPTYQW